MKIGMQQAWNLMVKPPVQVDTLEQLKACSESIAYLERRVDDNDILRIYAMPKGHDWPLGGKEAHDNKRFLIERPCWRPLWKAVLAKAATGSAGAIVSGTPGIGKSWFANFMLLQRAQDSQAGRTVLHDGKAYTITNFVGYGVESVATRQQTPDCVLEALPKPWYIYDPPEEEGNGGVVQQHAFVVITASPNPHHYKALAKVGGATFFMQPWTLLELEAVRDVMVLQSGVLSAEQVEERYQELGGVSRYVFSDEYSALLDSVEKAARSAKLKWVIDSLGADAGSLPPDKHKLFRYNVVDTADPRTIKIDLASEYVYRRILDAARSLKRHELAHWMFVDDAKSAALRGRIFESFCHGARAGGGRFRVRTLEEHGDAYSGVNELELQPVAQTTFHEFEEVLQCVAKQPKTPAIFVPDYPTFPVADAFALPCMSPPFDGVVAFQDTINADHGLMQAKLNNWLEELAKTNGALGSDKFLHVIFTVPPRMFDAYKKQRYTTAKDKAAKSTPVRVQNHVRQWVMRMPLVSLENALQGDHEQLQNNDAGTDAHAAATPAKIVLSL